VGFLSGTDLLHADDKYHGMEVAPSISVTTSKSNHPMVYPPSQIQEDESDTHALSISLQEYPWYEPGRPRSLRSYPPFVLSMDPGREHEGGKSLGKGPCMYLFRIWASPGSQNLRTETWFKKGNAMTYSSGLAAAFAVWNPVTPIFQGKDADEMFVLGSHASKPTTDRDNRRLHGCPTGRPAVQTHPKRKSGGHRHR